LRRRNSQAKPGRSNNFNFSSAAFDRQSAFSVIVFPRQHYRCGSSAALKNYYGGEFPREKAGNTVVICHAIKFKVAQKTALRFSG
jgi:hypothetical protein